MRRKMAIVMLSMLLVATAFIVPSTTGGDLIIKKVKVIPVPWQEWRIVWDPSGAVVIGVEDIIFFDPPQMPDDEVAIVREYAVLYVGEGPIPLEDLTWDGTQALPWEPVDDPAKPYILPLNGEVRLFIPTNENVSAVLVRYTVAWASTPSIIEAHFVNEAILESRSPQAIVGSLSNFDVHNDYNEPIDNFELELYGNIEPSDVLYVYDPPGGPYRWNTSFGTVWYGGWGAPPLITAIPGGIKIEWIDPDNPVPYCEWIHFGVALNMVKKVKYIPVPWQFWEFNPGAPPGVPPEVIDIIIYDPPAVSKDSVVIQRDYAVLDYELELDELMWGGDNITQLNWTPTPPVELYPNEEVQLNIAVSEDSKAVLLRYTVAWAATPDVIEAHFINEAILESSSWPTGILGTLSNFDVHNDYSEPIDNFELELYGTPPDAITGWWCQWHVGPPVLHPSKLVWDPIYGLITVGPVWMNGWGTPPLIHPIVDAAGNVIGTEIEWIEPDYPVKHCEWIHFGLYLNPFAPYWGAKAYLTQTLNLTGAKAYLTQLIQKADVDIKPGSDPNTINLKSKGRWISVTIELQEEYNCTDIDPSTVLWDGLFGPVLDPKYGWVKSEDSYCVDEDGDGVMERLFKFDRSDIEDHYGPGTHTVVITGKLNCGMPFEGSDSIRLINPP